MRVLFDQGTPVPLGSLLPNHQVSTAYARGWSELTNGSLLDAAESAGYEVFVTTDRNLRYQQNLSIRKIAIVVLGTKSWPRIRDNPNSVVAAVNNAMAGSYVEVAIG